VPVINNHGQVVGESRHPSLDSIQRMQDLGSFGGSFPAKDLHHSGRFFLGKVSADHPVVAWGRRYVREKEVK
jgi:hypothetical protein